MGLCCLILVREDGRPKPSMTQPTRRIIPQANIPQKTEKISTAQMSSLTFTDNVIPKNTTRGVTVPAAMLSLLTPSLRAMNAQYDTEKPADLPRGVRAHSTRISGPRVGK